MNINNKPFQPEKWSPQAHRVCGCIHDESMPPTPWLTFPSDWEVRLVQPFNGAAVRFLVRDPRKPEHRVSIYYDVAGNLGAYDGPYWEVYPYGGDVGRCAVEDAEELFRMIRASLEEMR